MQRGQHSVQNIYPTEVDRTHYYSSPLALKKCFLVLYLVVLCSFSFLYFVDLFPQCVCWPFLVVMFLCNDQGHEGGPQVTEEVEASVIQEYMSSFFRSETILFVIAYGVCTEL